MLSCQNDSPVLFVGDAVFCFQRLQAFDRRRLLRPLTWKVFLETVHRSYRCHLNHLGLLMIHYRSLPHPPPREKKNLQGSQKGDHCSKVRIVVQTILLRGELFVFRGVSLPRLGIERVYSAEWLCLNQFPLDVKQASKCTAIGNNPASHAAFSEGCASQRPEVEDITFAKKIIQSYYSHSMHNHIAYQKYDSMSL